MKKLTGTFKFILAWTTVQFIKQQELKTWKLSTCSAV